MFTENFLLKTIGTLFVAVVIVFYSDWSLAEYEPFPGKREVSVVRLDSPIDLVINFETWPGFRRTVTVQLRGLDIPQDTVEADACERELAAQVFGFSQEFINAAKKVYVNNLRMESSDDEFAYAHILTDQGRLSKALIKEGLARPDTVDEKESWCK